MQNSLTLKNDGVFPRLLLEWRFKGLLLILALALVYELPGHFSVTMTPSLNHRFFYLRYSVKVFSQGDYLLFPVSAILLPDPSGRKEKMVIKRVGCSEGQTLQTTGVQFYCDRVLLGQAKTVSKKGTRVAQFSYTGRVPEGRYFVIGDSPDSYDSRYFGFLRKEDILARAYPIF